ncbi:hypothetical protein CDAR_527491 [Caerostris darwini]|uniref:Uncharacterized protein n=1 Tax=Caerostris darwini TaxID=1538125 RepID=A0AAV4WJY2_9ARAC|nr:hypothetical protein CDAR_527491 [Caerostris darwini]
MFLTTSFFFFCCCCCWLGEEMKWNEFVRKLRFLPPEASPLNSTLLPRICSSDPDYLMSIEKASHANEIGNTKFPMKYLQENTILLTEKREVKISNEGFLGGGKLFPVRTGGGGGREIFREIKVPPILWIQ